MTYLISINLEIKSIITDENYYLLLKTITTVLDNETEIDATFSDGVLMWIIKIDMKRYEKKYYVS